MLFNIKLADKVIQVNSKYSYSFNLCKDFLTKEHPDLVIEISNDEIKQEQTGNFSVSYLESLAIYRKIATNMIAYDTFLIHGSAVCVNKKAYLFIGDSGAGKSTHARFWKELFDDDATIINDDKPLLQFVDNKVFVCGTPWSGKHGLFSNSKAELKSICLIKKSNINKISEYNNPEEIIKHVFKPKDIKLWVQTLDLLSRSLNGMKLYKLECRKELEAAKLAFNVMSKN